MTETLTKGWHRPGRALASHFFDIGEATAAGFVVLRSRRPHLVVIHPMSACAGWYLLPGPPRMTGPFPELTAEPVGRACKECAKKAGAR